MDLLAILKEAANRVPAMKYAFAVAALLAVVAIARQSNIGNGSAIVGSALVLGGMIIVVVFSAVAALGPTDLRLPALVLLWFVTTLFILGCLTLFSSVFWGIPKIQHLPWGDTEEVSTSVASDPASEGPASLSDVTAASAGSFQIHAADPWMRDPQNA